MTNIDDDTLFRSLAQLAGDPLDEAEAAEKSVRFAAAVHHMETSAAEAARIDALADSVAMEFVPSGASAPDRAAPVPVVQEIPAANELSTPLPVDISMPRRGSRTGDDEHLTFPTVLLARSAGAQPGVLRRARTDQPRFTAMGGVLVGTAAIAGRSPGCRRCSR
jgi:hypothetical protein